MSHICPVNDFCTKPITLILEVWQACCDRIIKSTAHLKDGSRAPDALVWGQESNGRGLGSFVLNENRSFRRQRLCRSLRALFLLGVGLFSSAFPVLACDGVPAGTTLWVQLISNISSYDSKPGTRVQAVLEDDIKCENEVILPIGTRIEGQIRRVQKVGWGIRHETAAIDLEFDRLLPEGDSPAEISARVVEVDNARESVKKGVIHGIRATDTPQGRINSRLKHLPTWNPYSDAVLITFKATFPIFPEPEIYYGPGTELRLELTSALHLPSTDESPSMGNEDLSSEDIFVLDEIALSEPERTYTRQHKVADVINLAFLGTREQVETAFHRANWVGSDHFSKRAFLSQFYALLNDSSYARAPMMPMTVDERLPDMTFQKSLNSYSKRDHLRVWQSEESLEGSPIWVAAATHDVGASLSVRRQRFVHHIEADIDEERAKVIRDLRLAGCVESVYLAPRPDVPRLNSNATDEAVTTDGELAVVRLKDCPDTRTTPPQNIQGRPGNRVFRYVRCQILTFRSDIWRANIIYGLYDLGRMMVTANAHRSAAAAMRPPPTVANASPPTSIP
jgi:LssY C-terminus